MKTNKKTKIIISVLAVIIAVLITAVILVLCRDKNEVNDLTDSPKKSHSATDKSNDKDGDKNDDIILGGGQYTVIELQKFVKLSFVKPGYNGYGVPELSFDESYLDKIQTDKYFKYISKQSEDVQWWLEDIESCEDLFEISLNYKDGSESYNNLSNGDKVYFEISLNDALTDEGLTLKSFCDGIGIKFDTTKTYLVVKDLVEPSKDLTKLDVLGHIKEHIRFDGVNGAGTVEFDFPKEFNFTIDGYSVYLDNFINYEFSRPTAFFYVVYDNKKAFDFTCTIFGANNKLDIGKSVTLKLEITENHNIVDSWCFTVTEYNILVKAGDLGYYLAKDKLESPSPKITENIKNYLKSQIEDITSFDSFYLATIKPGVISDHVNKHAIVVFFFCDDPEDSYGWFDGYYYAVLYDTYILDGKILTKDRDLITSTRSYSTVTDAYNKLDDNYTYKLIKKFE